MVHSDYGVLLLHMLKNFETSNEQKDLALQTGFFKQRKIQQ